MSPASTPQEPEAVRQSAPESDVRVRWGKFVPELEAAYQQEMERIRVERIYRVGIIGIVLYGAFALTDRAMLPDTYHHAWAIRFLLVLPFMVLSMLLLPKLRTPLQRETALALSILVSGISLPLIAGMSDHPNAVHYQTGITLIVMFGNIVLNLRFRTAFITSVTLSIVYGVTLAWAIDMPQEVRFNNWVFCFTSITISLIANFRMDQDRRRVYLAHVREQERNEELSHAVELLAKLSAEDALTQIANRREFDRRIDVEWGRARRDGDALTLILIDVDCFKSYNDHYGHPAGDLCLQKIAAVLKAIPRRSADLVARFGGEEFVVLLPGISAEDAAGLAERMRHAVAELQIPHATSYVAPNVTASFGVATLQPAACDGPEQLVAAADAALYKAKEKGRNRVVVHVPGEQLAMAAGVVH